MKNTMIQLAVAQRLLDAFRYAHLTDGRKVRLDAPAALLSGILGQVDACLSDIDLAVKRLKEVENTDEIVAVLEAVRRDFAEGSSHHRQHHRKSAA